MPTQCDCPDPSGQDGGPVARCSLLESSGMLDTFIFLRSIGKCRKTDLYKGIGRGSEMAVKLDRLEDAGLIVQERYERTTFLSLTEDGVQVADRIIGIQEVLSGIGTRAS